MFSPVPTIKPSASSLFQSFPFSCFSGSLWRMYESKSSLKGFSLLSFTSYSCFSSITSIKKLTGMNPSLQSFPCTICGSCHRKYQMFCCILCFYSCSITFGAKLVIIALFLIELISNPAFDNSEVLIILGFEISR